MNEEQPIINKFIPQSRTAEGLGDYIKKYLIPILVLLSLAIQVFGQSNLLDEFKTTDGWKVYISDGAKMKISQWESDINDKQETIYNLGGSREFCGIVSKNYDSPKVSSWRYVNKEEIKQFVNEKIKKNSSNFRIIY